MQVSLQQNGYVAIATQIRLEKCFFPEQIIKTSTAETVILVEENFYTENQFNYKTTRYYVSVSKLDQLPTNARVLFFDSREACEAFIDKELALQDALCNVAQRLKLDKVGTYQVAFRTAQLVKGLLTETFA
jgi:hypothetical protein